MRYINDAIEYLLRDMPISIHVEGLGAGVLSTWCKSVTCFHYVAILSTGRSLLSLIG